MESYERLERELADWAGYEPGQVVACSSGTAALHLAFESLRMPANSEVLVPDFGMIACPRSATLAGLKPVFVDCDERLNISAPLVRRAIERREEADALLAVHVYGRRCDMDALAESSREAGPVFIVEDLAEAHGVRPHPETDAACWSHYKNKAVGGAEGGSVAFRDPEHAAYARRLRSLGFGPEQDYSHAARGHNYRLSNAHADLVLQSLARFEGNAEWRREIEGWHDAACPNEWRMPPRAACWVYDLKIPGLTRARQGEIVRALNASGIAARHSFLPMSQQEEYRSCRLVLRPDGRHRASEAAECVFYLPVVPGVTTRETVRLAFEVIYTALG